MPVPSTVPPDLLEHEFQNALRPDPYTCLADSGGHGSSGRQSMSMREDQRAGSVFRRLISFLNCPSNSQSRAASRRSCKRPSACARGDRGQLPLRKSIQDTVYLHPPRRTQELVCEVAVLSTHVSRILLCIDRLDKVDGLVICTNQHGPVATGPALDPQSRRVQTTNPQQLVRVTLPCIDGRGIRTLSQPAAAGPRSYG